MSDPVRRVMVVPGANFGPMAGLMAYAVAVAERRGASIRFHDWGPMSDLSLADREPWVRDQLLPIAADGPGPLIIGKSLGTLAAGVAADLELPAVWLTPLLTIPACVDSLRRATAPFLLVGGTADSWWNGSLARELSSRVVEVDGGDHGLLVPGPLDRSTDALGTVLSALDAFLAEIWGQPLAR